MKAPARSPVLSEPLLAMLGLAVVYGVHLTQLGGWWGPGHALQGWPYVLVFVGCGALILRLATRTAEVRAWQLVGVGTALWGVGQLIYASSPQPVPMPGLNDVFFLSLPACFLLALLRFERRWPSLPGTAAKLDVAALVVSAGGYLWFYQLAPQLAAPTGDVAADLTSAAYPLADLLLLALLLAHGWRTREGAPCGTWLLALGVLGFIVADLGFTSLTLRGTYTGNEWPDALWPLAALAFAGATWRATVRPRRFLPTWIPLTGAHTRLAPYAALLSSFALLLNVPELRSPAGAGVALTTFVVSLLVAARQTLALRELQDHRTLLHHQAHHDPLTGLGNRAQLDAVLGGALAGDDTVGLLFVDLDDFKFVNDALGHRAGDLFLQEVARRLCGAAGPGTTCVRLGGDEFVVVLTPATRDTLEALSERVVLALRESVTLSGQRLQITASVGAALSTRQQRDPAALLRWADQAMYEVKRTGKNALSIYTPGVHDQLAARRVLIETRLRGVLERGELSLHYQPQRDQDGRLRRFEALLRWTDPQLGPVSPGEFVPIAEMAGLMVALDNWVIDEACRQLALWLPVNPDRQVAVNISPPHLVRSDFLPGLQRTLQRHGIPPHALELEVTERLLIENEAQARDTLRALLDLGVHVAIDDFGVGQSSLAALLRLPITTLKIDRAFTHELETGAVGSAQAQAAYTVVQAIVALGQALALRVVAEGVETPTQAQLLQGLGVDALQGYWIGRASPPEGAPFFTMPESSGLGWSGPA
ncbi:MULTISPECIES: putative bifunctional diguanylate cyclase/phosphodiesterase [Deinococcus]|uniref:Bifunctional diguanylate cyclase/phosphodiesterase n=1 Tax=Deinococcus rufus TaxID=2136097 RepID=A0ABV7Z4U2_9DEIO|nr:EAL domain-containing protein [Deinococcus sp. AB2017081]WQE94840.1 EAL domain-containing protein [Deinococcus sp. AB2017081]